MPKVSVIIPTYNREKALGRAIDSVLEQTCGDFEIIVVDDGSTDGTREVVGAYRERVRYIYQENEGPSCARNRGIEASKAKYIAFLDSDDYYARENLLEKVNFLEANSESGWVYSDGQYVDESGGFLERVSDRHNFSRRRVEGDIFEELLYYRNFITTPTVVVRREVLERTGGFDERLSAQEDYELWLRIAVKYPIHYIDKPLVFMTEHADSLSQDFSKWVCGNAVVVDKLERLIPHDFPGKDSFLKRAHADKYTFIGRDLVHKGEFSSAILAYLKAIRRLPLQKKVYWLVLLAMIQSVRKQRSK